MTSCSETPDVPTSQFIEDLPSLAESMGMSAECVQTATTASEAGGASVSGKAEASIPFASGSASFDSQAWYSSIENEMTQSGCGSFMMNATSVYNSQLNMNCTLSNTDVTSSFSGESVSSVSIQVLPLTTEQTAAKTELEQSIMTATAAALAFASEEGYADILNGMNDMAQTLLESYSRTLNIENSSITASSDTNISGSITVTDEQINELVGDYSTIASNTAEQAVQASSGLNALSENTREMISSEVNNQLSNIQESIKNTVQDTTITATSSSLITISAPGNINIANSTIDSSSLATIMVDIMSQNAMGTGISIAQDIVNQAVTGQGSITDSAGLDDLQEAIADTVTGAIDSNQTEYKPTNNTMWIVMAIVVGLLVIGGIVAAYFAYKTGTDPNTAKTIAAAKGMGFGGPMKGSNFGNPMTSIYKYIGLAILAIVIIGIIYMAIKWNSIKKNMNPTNWF